MPAGKVFIFNPTSSDYILEVNGRTQIDLPGTSGSLGWAAGTTANPCARTDDGNNADGKFGWSDNIVTVQLKAGRAQAAEIDLTIPHDIQNSNDLQLYIYYSGDFANATYTLLNQGAIIAKGGLTAAS